MGRTWKYEYQGLGKGYKDPEPRQFVIRTDVPVEMGHTFRNQYGAWAVVDVDAENVWCAPWFFDRHTRDIQVETP